MLLYHGSNTDIKEIDLAMCRPYKDFGQGFYLTILKEQAEKMAKRVARIYGSTPVVNIYEFDDSAAELSGWNVLNFGDKPSEEWARFVMNNRSHSYRDYESPECNFDCKYDIVTGPIANDDIAVLFRQYENEMISFSTLVDGMTFRETTNQYSFHTERAIALLRKVGTEG